MTDERRPEQAADHDQPSPGRQADMQLQPQGDLSSYKPAGKLAGEAALVTGGDSGIGSAPAYVFLAAGAPLRGGDGRVQGDRRLTAGGKRPLTPP